MVRYLRFIGFLVLAFALWQTASGAFAGETVDGRSSVNEREVVVFHQQEETCIATPQLPYLPEAELAGSVGQSQLLTFLRMQRSVATECIFLLKDMPAQWAATMFLHCEDLYDDAVYYCCHPSCEYYIFALRRILI